MNKNIKIDFFEDEIKKIEEDINNNIDIINIIYILVDNNSIETVIKKKMEIEGNILKKSDIKYILDKTKEIDIDNEYKIKYLLKFLLNEDIDSLNTISSKNNHILESIKSIDNIDFNDKNNFKDTNSLIIILDKKEKVYYIKKKIKNKNNITKKYNKKM